ncbi:hypothetical protein BC829DRAFT_250553 [Chytridium lagenaria]|nr:hypothetical protein BC829DRAFT_250553 [Chytridium lagenaria]
MSTCVWLFPSIRTQCTMYYLYVIYVIFLWNTCINTLPKIGRYSTIESPVFANRMEGIVMHGDNVSFSSLPVEVVCTIMDMLSLRERAMMAVVGRQTLAGFRDTKILELRATPNLVKTGIENIIKQFPRLKSLSLRLRGKGEEDMEACVSAGLTFSGHAALTHLISDTSAVLRGTRRCPRLRSIYLSEPFTMPIPHLLDMADNGVSMIFRKLPTITHLDIDCPLLWAINRFSHWRMDEDADIIDSPTSPNYPTETICIWNLEELCIRSLHNDSISDFMLGLVRRAAFPCMRKLHLAGDEAIVPVSSVKLLTQACPCLEDISFASLHFEEDLAAILQMLPPGLNVLSLSLCDIRMQRYEGMDNLALELVAISLRQLPSLATLEVNQCKFSRTPQSALAYLGTFQSAELFRS